MATAPREYLSGFGNELLSEAVAGAVPREQNSPQRAPLGLYAEQLSGTAFTQPRAISRRTWLYRVLPSARHPAFARTDDRDWRSAPFTEREPDPNRLRWDPMPLPTTATDFLDGVVTVGGNGDVGARSGMAVHWYACSAPMTDRVFVDSDGELLLVPQDGSLVLRTELGVLDVAPGEIALIPPGVRGPIGAIGLADARHFLAPVASFESGTRPVQVVQRFGGHLWAADYDHSPLDVVGWHGNYLPMKYDLSLFMAVNTVTFDHVDPSVFTVLTSGTDTPGLANVDFVIFPPRWSVAEHTFRPPWFHRNTMSEFMGLVRGAYDAKAEGFAPGGSSLHNGFSSHGPDAATQAQASAATLEPVRVEDTLAFMFETRWPIVSTARAMDAPWRQAGYDEVWADLPANFTG